MNDFFNVIAWVLGVGSSIMLVLKLIARATYTERQKLFDRMRGFQKTWPITRPTLIAFFCWVWIITEPLK